MIPWLSATVAVYALLTIAGGIAGYVSKQSMASLMAGVGVGILMFVGLAVVSKKPAIGYAITAVLTILLIGRMLPTFLKDGTIWPAGIMAFAGIAVLIAHIAGHFMARKG